ncbi:gene transfer agent family protein [Mesorhizobium sp. M0118]|uniref:gene transfer agent family protein n=1 Tax=Mesorhizobium sp. M0118 TaxID=2956884 RepID=UPI00333E1555
MRPSETIVWPGGEHEFRLGIGELRAIEQRCDAGCFVVMMRLLSSQAKIDDILSPIRLGLIGSGMAEKDAQRIVDGVLSETASPYTLTVTAAEVLRRFLMWNDEDSPLGEQKAGAATADPR